MKAIFGTLSVLSLALCLGAAIGHLWGQMSQEAYRSVFLAASLAWFVFAVLWAEYRRRI